MTSLPKIRKEMLIGILAALIWTVYIPLLISYYPKYINSIDIDPLAMIHSLFPVFNILLVLFASLGYRNIFSW